MDIRSLIRRAAEILADLPGGGSVNYCAEIAGIGVYAHCADDVRALGGVIDCSRHADGWYGGEDDGRWQREVSVLIDGIRVFGYDVERRSPAGEQAGGALAASAVAPEATAGAPCASGAPKGDDAPTCARCGDTGTLPECSGCEGCLCLGEGGRFGGRASGCGGPCDCGAGMPDAGLELYERGGR